MSAYAIGCIYPFFWRNCRGPLVSRNQLGHGVTFLTSNTFPVQLVGGEEGPDK